MNKYFSFLFLGLLCIFPSVQGEDNRPLTATVTVRADSLISHIDRKIYGQMVENCGNCLYPGLWVGENSDIPNIRGMRKDVIEKFKEIKTPVVRWPGGTPSEYYHWLDGIGPKEKRPRTLLPGLCLASPGETNQFGTDEFMDFCRLIGAEPYICANVGTGTAEEAGNWVEYCNRDGETQYAGLRKQNGHQEPYGVKYWGIGNESYFWHTPESYTLVVKQYAKVMKTMVDTSIRLVAAGFNDPHVKGMDRWNYQVLKNANEFLDYISLHAYYFYDDYYDVVACPLKLQKDIDSMRLLIRKLVPGNNRLEIAVDEWNIWHKEAKTYNGLMQKCTLMDGLYAAGMFHVFHRNSDIVTMANFCDLVNQLPAIVTREDGALYVNPIFLAFKLYANHTGTLRVLSRTQVASFAGDSVGVGEVPYLDVSVTRNEEGKSLSIAVINRHREKEVRTTFRLEGFLPRKEAEVWILNAPEATSANDFDHPEKVVLRNKTFKKAGNTFVYTFPAHSVTVLDLIEK